MPSNIENLRAGKRVVVNFGLYADDIERINDLVEATKLNRSQVVRVAIHKLHRQEIGE